MIPVQNISCNSFFIPTSFYSLFIYFIKCPKNTSPNSNSGFRGRSFILFASDFMGVINIMKPVGPVSCVLQNKQMFHCSTSEGMLGECCDFFFSIYFNSSLKSQPTNYVSLNILFSLLKVRCTSNFIVQINCNISSILRN